jgi:alpha-1,3-fucosyltransferase
MVKIKFFLILIIASLIILIFNNYQFLNASFYTTKTIIKNSTKDINNFKCNVFTNLTNEKYLINGKQYPNFVPLIYNKSIDLKCLRNKKNTNKSKIILLWTKFNGEPLIPIQLGTNKAFDNLKCLVNNCELTNDRSKLNKSDFVLFHLRNKIDYFPPYRKKNQRWIHVIYESPIHCHLCDKYENVFNLSATYTKNSHFTSLYWLNSGIYWEKNLNYLNNNNNNNNNADIHANKTEFAAALMSNCDNGQSKRQNYLNELKTYIALNIFGKCGKPCPINNDCREYISKHYKFFLLFENSICTDYITEKFFLTLRYDIIPG